MDATGLVQVGARYYDPALGRFVSVDPVMDLADPQQWHGYAYANNNPITWSDPTGLYGKGVGKPGPKWHTPGDTPVVPGAKAQTVTPPVTRPMVGGIFIFGELFYRGGSEDAAKGVVSWAAGSVNGTVAGIPNMVRNSAPGQALGRAFSGQHTDYWQPVPYPFEDDVYQPPYHIGEVIGPQILIGGARLTPRVTGLGTTAAPRPLATGGATTSAFSNLTHSSFGIAPYRAQQTAGHRGEIAAHQLIERRFADVMDQAVGDMPSIVVTRPEHQVFTNAWRAEIPYGSRNVTPTQVNDAARRVYADYPEILQALGLG